MSTSDIQAARSLFESLMSRVSASDRVSARKTRKGQANARKSESITPAVEVAPDLNAWVPPMSFGDWCESIGEKRFVRSEACEQLLAGYAEYVRVHFSAPITFGERSSFAKVVRKQVRAERAGKANLGLLGYSADDIGARAVMDALADAWQAYLLSIDSDEHKSDARTKKGKKVQCVCFACEVKRALSDRRTDEQLRADARQFDTPRYEWESEYKRVNKDEEGNVVSTTLGRVRTRSPRKAVTKALSLYETRLKLYAYIADNDVPLIYPSVGDTYRKVSAVIHEGLREFRNTVEGYTPDGLLSDDLSYIGGYRIELEDKGFDRAIARLDRSMSIEDAFTHFGYSKSEMIRNATMEYLLNRDDLLPAEMQALATLELFNRGYSFADVLEALGYKDASKLNALLRDARDLIAEAQATEEYITYRERAMMAMLTQAVADALA